MVGGEQRSKTSPWPHLSRVAEKKRKKSKTIRTSRKERELASIGVVWDRESNKQKKNV